MTTGTENAMGHFLLLDIGHPMAYDAAERIRCSLLNVLSLASCLRGGPKIPVFGLGALERHLRVVHQWSLLVGNYFAIARNSESIGSNMETGMRITLREYKNMLENGILRIVDDFDFHAKDWESSKAAKNKLGACYLWPRQIKLTLITKKAASPIVEMIKERVEALSRTSLKQIEIIEIRDESSESEITHRDLGFISCTTISDNPIHLDHIFKTWLSDERATDHEQLRLLLHRESDFRIKCDVDDCVLQVLSPPFRGISQALDFPPFSRHEALTDDKTSIRELEVISKIGLSDLSASLSFGFPHRIYATRSSCLNQHESEFNETLFRSLCAELQRLGLGLVTQTTAQFDSKEIKAFHFIVSDGEKILMTNIVPFELQLPQRPAPTPVPLSQCNDLVERASCLVHSSLNRIRAHRESLLTAGIYETLQQCLEPKKRNRRDGCDCGSRQKEKKHFKAGEEAAALLSEGRGKGVPPGEYTPKFLQAGRKEAVEVGKKRIEKRKKANSNESLLHPALMSPETVRKYRKLGPRSLSFPELNEPGIVEK